MPTLFKEDWSGSGWTSSWSGSWTVGESCSHGGCVLNPDASVPTNWTNLYDDNYYYSRPPANLNNTCRVVSYDKTTYGSNYASYSLSEGIQAISYVTFYVNIWSHNFAVDDGFQMGALVSGNGIMVSRVKFVNKSDGVTEQLGAKVEIWNPAASGHPINEDPIQNDNFAWIEEQKWYRIQYMVDWTNLLWDFRIYDVPEHKIIRLLESHEGSIPTGAQLPTAGAAYPLPNFPRRVIAGSFGCDAAASGPSVEMYMGAVQWDTTGFPGPELDRPTRAYRPFTASGLGMGWTASTTSGNWLQPLSQTSRDWTDMAGAPNGDIYACVDGGDIYKQTGGSGNFIALGQTSRQWTAMTVAPNGDVYAATQFPRQIYKQTGGSGDFVSLNQTLSEGDTALGMVAEDNGDVWACAVGGDGGSIYRQTGGSGDFNLRYHNTGQGYGCMTISSTGSFYVGVYGGPVLEMIFTDGLFQSSTPLDTTSCYWGGLMVDNSGVLFAADWGGDNGGDIYRYSGTAFVALELTYRRWRSFINTAGGIYGCVQGGDIYKGSSFPYSALDKGSGEDYKMVSSAASDRQGFVWRARDSMPRILALRWRIKAKGHNGVANRNFMINTSWEEFDLGRTHEVYGGERGGMYISAGTNYKLFTAELFENPLTELPWDENDFLDDCDNILQLDCEEGDRINGIIGSLQSVNSDNPTQPQYPGGDICEYWAEFIVAPNDGQDYSYLTNGPRFGGVTDSTIRVWVRCYGPAKVRIMFGTSSANVKNSTPTSLQGDTKITDNPSVDNAVAANDYSITIDLVESCSTLSSLSADTKYYFDVYVDGVSTYQMERDPLIGTAESWDVLPECRTFPTEGVWADFDFLVGADKHDAAENYQIYESMGGTFTTPRFYIDLGDEMASDADVLDLQEFAYPDDRIAFARLTSQRMGYKYRRGLNAFNVRFATNIERRMPIDRIWSDHDYAADNATKTGWVPRSNITDGLAIYWRKLLDANSDSYAFELTRVNSRYGGKSTLAIYGWYCTVASIDSATENSDGSWEVTFTYSSPSWAAGDNLSQPVEENNVGWNRSVDFGQLENWDEGNDRMTIATEPSTGNPLEVGDVLRGGGRLVVSRTDGFMLHVHGSSYGNDGYYRARSAGLFWDGPSVFELGHTITADEDPIPNAQNSGPNGVTVDFYTFRTYNCLDGFRQSGPHYDWPANDLTGVVTSGEGAQFSDIGSIYRQFHYYNATNEIYIEEGDSCIIDGPGGTPTATVRYVDTVLNVLVIEMDTPSNVFESGTISAVAPDGPWSATILTEATVPEYGPGVLNFPTYSKYGVYPGMIVYRFEDSSLSDDTVTFGIVTKNYGTYIELSGLVPYDSNGGPVSFTAGNRYRIKTGGLWHSFKYGNAEFFFMDVCYKGDKLDLTDPFGQDVVRSKGIAGAPEILNPGLPGCDRLDGTREGVAPKFTGTVNEYLKNGMRDTTTNFETGGPFGDGVVRGDVVHNVDSDQWAIVYSVSGSSITLRDKFYYGGPKELFVLGSGQYTYAIYESGASDHGSRTANERAGHIQREWLINSLNDSTADWRFLLSQDPLIGVKPWDYNEHWETCDGVLDAQRGYLKEKIDNSLSMGGLVGFGGDQHFAALSDGQPSSSDLPFPFINVSPLYSEWIPAITHTPHDKNSWMVDGKYAACGRDQSAGYPVGIRNWGAYGAVQATLNQLTITIRETDGTVMNNSAMVMNNPPGPNIGDMTMTVTKAGNYGLGYIPARMVADGAFSSTGGVLVAQGMLTTSASLSGSFSTTGAISVLLVDLYSSVSWEGSFSTSGATYTMKPMAYVVKGVAPEEDFDMVMNFTPIEVLTNKYIGKYKKHWVDSGNDAFKKVVSKMNVDSENIYGVIEDELELPWIKDDAMASEVLTFWTTFRGKERITLELDLMWLSTNIEVGSYMSLDMTGWSDGILAPFQTGNFMVIEKSYEWAQERRVLKLLQI